jgi:hypothetical protein
MQPMLGNHPAVRESGSGSLSPRWVEWLMGFPDGHTVLEPSEMPSSRSKRIPLFRAIAEIEGMSNSSNKETNF